MRVVQVINSIAPTRGGPTYVVVQLSRALAALGVEVDVIATRADLDEASEAEVRAVLGDVPLHLAEVHGPARFELAPRLIPILWQRLRQADVAHLHTVFTWPVAVAPLLCRARRVPYVLRPAGTLDETCLQTGHTRQKKLAVSTYVRAALAGAATLQATSELEAANLRRLAPRSRVMVVEPGVEIPDSVGPPSSGKRRIGTLGRLHPIKRLETLLHAAARLERVELWLAGAGEPAYVASLQQLARSLGVAARFLGHVDARGKAQFLAACDVLAFPSLHESFGVAVAEAMAAGRPVVVSPEVGLADVIVESGAGRVARAHPDDLSLALAAILSDEPWRVRAGAAARALAASRWQWREVARRALHLYYQSLNCAPSDLSE